MAMLSKNSRVGRDRNAFFLPDRDSLPRHNYATGAGWKTRKGAKIGKMSAEKAFDIRRKKR
jgi:hypothetical protein